MRRTRPTLFALSFLLALPTAMTLAQAPPPVAPVREVTDTYFGQDVVDPYRWLESTKDAEVVAWMKAQDDYTRAVLDRIPGRRELLTRIDALNNAGIAVVEVQRGGGLFFYLKNEPGSDYWKLYVRDGLKGQERLLVDPEKLGKDGKHWSIDYFTPSLDGKYVAYGVSEGGSENSVLHVLESATGQGAPGLDRPRAVRLGVLAKRRALFRVQPAPEARAGRAPDGKVPQEPRLPPCPGKGSGEGAAGFRARRLEGNQDYGGRLSGRGPDAGLALGLRPRDPRRAE